jgi:predicted Co/Zn/Cd cation transporter (cation efflux family)
MQQAAAIRDIEQTQNASSLQGASYLIGFFALASLLLGLNAFTLPQSELACSNPRNLICAIAQTFGGKNHLNTAYAIIYLILGMSFGLIAWKLYRKSLNKITAALARELDKK